MLFKDKRVLVTGGAGVIGRELIASLSAQGAIIRCVDLQERPPEFNESIDYFRADLADEKCQFLFRFDPEFVFHLAADFERVEESSGFWESNFRNNILASRNVLDKITRCPDLKKVVFASSYLIYDRSLYTDTSNINLLTEDSRIDPRNITGLAKLQTERDLAFLNNSSPFGFMHVSARIFRVFGRGSRDIISRWIRALLREEKITVFGETNQFDYIYAKDVAKGLVTLAQSPDATGIFNLGSGVSSRISDVISILRKHFPDAVMDLQDEVYMDESSCASMSKFDKCVGPLNPCSLDEGIEEIVLFEKCLK